MFQAGLLAWVSPIYDDTPCNASVLVVESWRSSEQRHAKLLLSYLKQNIWPPSSIPKAPQAVANYALVLASHVDRMLLLIRRLHLRGHCILFFEPVPVDPNAVSSDAEGKPGAPAGLRFTRVGKAAGLFAVYVTVTFLSRTVASILAARSGVDCCASSPTVLGCAPLWI